MTSFNNRRGSSQILHGDSYHLSSNAEKNVQRLNAHHSSSNVDQTIQRYSISDTLLTSRHLVTILDGFDYPKILETNILVNGLMVLVTF